MNELSNLLNPLPGHLLSDETQELLSRTVTVWS